MKKIALFVLMATSLLKMSFAVQTIEAETAKWRNPLLSVKSRANNTKALYLHQGDVVTFPVCLMDATTLTITDVWFSNAGGEDELSLEFDNNEIGTFKTPTDYGGWRAWDNFKSSGQLGQSFRAERGLHRLRLSAIRSDQYGVEIDKIVFKSTDDYLSDSVFNCKLPCLQETPALPKKANIDVTDGYIEQKSYPTQCAEEDNVHIPVFHPSVSEYRVSATMPKYDSFVNLRTGTTENCPYVTPIYWDFRDVDLSSLATSPATVTSKNAVLSATDSTENDALYDFVVKFRLYGPSMGLHDSEIGSKLHLNLSGLTSNTDISISYKGRDPDFKKFPPVKYSPTSMYHSWDIPDFSWKETQDRDLEIRLKISTDPSAGIVMEQFSLERRHKEPEQAGNQEIYRDDYILIEVLDVDFWWRAPHTMELTLTTTNQKFNNVDFMRITLAEPWDELWNEVFVLYQDGNVRLVPLAPPGVDWIPFGTSVIVGQTDYTDIRPIAPIAKLEVDPILLTLDLTYRDGATAKMELRPLFGKTEVRVTNINMSRDTSHHPFATFRSMFAHGGNDDSDSVMTDKTTAKHVMANWNKMNGTSFRVFRRCESTHLTQSPDLTIDIINA